MKGIFQKSILAAVFNILLLFWFCFVFLFVVFFFVLKKKKLGVWGHHWEGKKGYSSSLLHAGGWTGQFVEEQIGVAGASLAGGHGCDTVERTGKSQSLGVGGH